ncbi:hypothetical protein J3F83DRAFT_767462 [Trichoderma novae-zelandiae]
MAAAARIQSQMDVATIDTLTVIAHLRHAPRPAALRLQAPSGGSAAGAPALSADQVFCCARIWHRRQLHGVLEKGLVVFSRLRVEGDVMDDVEGRKAPPLPQHLAGVNRPVRWASSAASTVVSGRTASPRRRGARQGSSGPGEASTPVLAGFTGMDLAQLSGGLLPDCPVLTQSPVSLILMLPQGDKLAWHISLAVSSDCTRSIAICTQILAGCTRGSRVRSAASRL